MNFIIGDPTGHPDLVKIYFDNEPVETTAFTHVEDLMVFANVFKSKGEARRNGFKGEISFGLNKVGPKRTNIWVWRIPLDLESLHDS